MVIEATVRKYEQKLVLGGSHHHQGFILWDKAPNVVKRSLG